MEDPLHSFVECLGYSRMVDLILQATERIYLAMPNVHQEISEALREARKRGLDDIRVVIDVSENQFRKRYGDIEAVETLRQIGCKVFDVTGNMISFLSCDDFGYFIFPQSRVFSTSESGLNAVRINALSIVRILNQFFPPESFEAKELPAKRLEQAVSEVESEALLIATGIGRPQTNVVSSLLTKPNWMRSRIE